MELKDYTTEELRAELKKRNAEGKANLFSNFKKQGDNTIAVCLKGDYLLRDIIPFDENKVGKIE